MTLLTKIPAWDVAAQCFLNALIRETNDWRLQDGQPAELIIPLTTPPNQANGEMVYDAEREIYFPQRPARPESEVYRRYDPRVRKTLNFRVADPARDAEHFTRWMNDPRVEYFWEQSGSLEHQTAYLERQLNGKHAFPLIGCFDDQPFSYFEIYWAAEDRIGRHYAWQPYDRGLHLLVGEQAWRAARILNRAIGRDLFDLSLPTALIQWRSGSREKPQSEAAPQTRYTASLG